MPAPDSPSLVVARYLKSNHLTQSYEAFISEAGLPSDAGNSSKGDLTLEILLEEKRNFDVSLHFEKLGVGDSASSWHEPAPSSGHEITSLPSASNILSVSVETVQDSDDQTIRVSHPALHDSPILCCTSLHGRYIATASMSGQLHLSSPDGRIFTKRRDHAKYVVKIAVFEGSETIIATAGWDQKVRIYKSHDHSELELDSPSATIPLLTKPEAILFIRHPEHEQPVLLIARTDSNSIYYYTVEPTPRLLGKQNLAPHSNAWVAFTPSSMALCPTDPTSVAVATSTVPHMKLLIVRLLVPPWNGSQAHAQDSRPIRTSLLDEAESATETQASQARAALAVADREDAAIQIHCSTLAPQTAYSTPAVVWRPNGSGVWVNGDDGVIRGIETSSGKIVATLHGHETGSKVRCLWAGNVVQDSGQKQEVLVSGGFDHKLIVWTT